MGSRNAEDYDDYGQDELIGDIEAMLVSPIQETPPNRFGSNVRLSDAWNVVLYSSL